jgi:hypothetical protein
MNIKCFFVEPTVNVEIRESRCSCGCGEMVREERREFRRTDTGETKWSNGPSSFGVGAMFYVHYERGYGTWDNDDRHHLVVITPGGFWDIDSRASNCTMKEDGLHRCWIRHGAPPNVTVDKRGFTCSAGAGSIAQEGYHGFLRNGELVPA